MQVTQQLEVRLEEFDPRLWSHSPADPGTGASGASGVGVYRFVAHVLDDGVDLCGRPFAMARRDAEAADKPDATVSLALARLCDLDEQLQESGWRKLADLGRHWWSLRYTRD
jgi:hypothetical protein